MSTLNEAFEMEKSAYRVLNSFKRDLVKKIREAPCMEGVHIEKDTGGKAVLVDANVIGREKNLSPETYIPSAQADAVDRALNSCSSVVGTILELNTMVKSGKVKVKASSNSYTVQLNQKTLEIINESIADFNRDIA